MALQRSVPERTAANVAVGEVNKHLYMCRSCRPCSVGGVRWWFCYGCMCTLLIRGGGVLWCTVAVLLPRAPPPQALSASDDDVGQEVFFSIEEAGNEAGFFRINKCSGQLYVAKAGLDFGTQSTYVLLIRVDDDPEFFKTQAGKGIAPTRVTVHVTDVNDVPILCTDLTRYPPPLCEKEVKGFEVYEDGGDTAPIFGLDYVTDLDGDTLEFSLKVRRQEEAAGRYSIHSGSIHSRGGIHSGSAEVARRRQQGGIEFTAAVFTVVAVFTAAVFTVVAVFTAAVLN